MSTADPCLELLRHADPDRYVACLYLPVAWRRDAAAIHAFNAEIARIAERASEPMAGELRIQWWREVVGGARDRGDHPVAVALLDTIARHALPRQVFDASLQARLFDLYHDPMPDLEAFETYAGETHAALLHCVALCAGMQPGSGLADATGHAGVATVATAVLRSLSWHRAAARCYLPLDMLAAAGLDRESWLAAPDTRHENAVRAMAGLAREHLARAMAALGRLDRAGHALFLPLAVVPAYLGAVEADPRAAMSVVPTIGPLRRQWIFWRAAARGLRAG